MASKILLVLLAAAISVTHGFNKQPHCKCGQRNPSRIVGGTVAGVNEWPWQAGLVYGSQVFCGGSLLNDRYVLTAAHCIMEDKAADVKIWLSDHIVSTSGETSKVERSVSKFIVHEGYVPGDETNDIALVKLSSPVDITANVLPVCLPPPNPLYSNQVATATGWGKLNSGDATGSDILREVTVPILTPNQCTAAYGSSITDKMMCAGETGRDTCQGDSGGPLVFKDGGGNYDQVGITSWGKDCGKAGYPGVYTRVNKYLDWIDANTADAEYCKGF